MRTKAFGDEAPGTLLASVEVARQSLDVLLSGQTGHVIDIRREDGPAAYRQRLSTIDRAWDGLRDGQLCGHMP